VVSFHALLLWIEVLKTTHFASKQKGQIKQVRRPVQRHPAGIKPPTRPAQKIKQSQSVDIKKRLKK